MIQGCEYFRFALEPGEAFTVASDRCRQHLDGDLPFQVRVGRSIHFAHPACPEQCEDLVGAEARVGVQRQGRQTGWILARAGQETRMSDQQSRSVY